jgi:hypothetical protein
MKTKDKQKSEKAIFLISVLIIYITLFFIHNMLQFPFKWDEYHFWETSLSFSHTLIPQWEQLKSYNEPNTPLPFLIFGSLEYFFHGGIFAGRLLNLILSFLIVCIVGLPKYKGDKYSIRAVGALLIFPYYLFLSTHLYTDIIAALFVLLGFRLYFQEKHILSSLSFILAIASRQYMLAFPVAIGIFELLFSLKKNKRISISWIAPMIAAASILGWIWFFGGLVPQPAATIANIPTKAPQNGFELSWLFPDRGLYFLACIGLYFCIPEFLLFRKWTKLDQLGRNNPPAKNSETTANISTFKRFKNFCQVALGNLLTLKNSYIALGLLFLFAIYPPLDSKGILTKAVQIFPSSFFQATLLYILIFLVCVRFSRLDLTFWILLMNCGILMKGYAWDKYALAAVVVLWYLKSIQALDGESSFSLPFSQDINVSDKPRNKRIIVPPKQ